MKVGAGGESGGPDTAYERPCGDLLAAPDGERGQVGVHRANAVAVTDDDEVAPAAAVPTRLDYPPGAGCPDRSTVRSRKVEAGVEAVAARAEPIAEPCADGPGEANRRAGTRRPQRGNRRRAG